MSPGSSWIPLGCPPWVASPPPCPLTAIPAARMSAKDQMRRLHWHFSKGISSSRRGGLACVPKRGCLSGRGPHLAPDSWCSPLAALLSWRGPHRPLSRLGVRDFTAAFFLPACGSRRGCFHFYSRKKPIPSTSATARAQRPPGSRCHVRCFGGAGSSANHGLNCCHSGSCSSPGWLRVTGMAWVDSNLEEGSSVLTWSVRDPRSHLLAPPCPQSWGCPKAFSWGKHVKIVGVCRPGVSVSRLVLSCTRSFS